jgi:hypothetical protein
MDANGELASPDGVALASPEAVGTEARDSLFMGLVVDCLKLPLRTPFHDVAAGRVQDV